MAGGDYRRQVTLGSRTSGEVTVTQIGAHERYIEYHIDSLFLRGYTYSTSTDQEEIGNEYSVFRAKSTEPTLTFLESAFRTSR